MSISSIYTSPFFTPLAPGMKAPINPTKPVPTVQDDSALEVPYVIARNGTYQQTAAYKVALKLPETITDANGNKIDNPERAKAIAKAKRDGAVEAGKIGGQSEKYGIRADGTYGPANGGSVAKAIPERIINSQGYWVENPDYIKQQSGAAGRPADPLGAGATPNPLVSDAKLVAKENDLISLSSIIKSDGNNVKPFDSYKIALRDNHNGGTPNGALYVNGQLAVATDGIYTLNDLEFNNAYYKVSAIGTSDELLVAGVVNNVDGFKTVQYSTPLAVQMTSGLYRSINAASAVTLGAGGISDPTLELAQNAEIYAPISGQKRPELVAAKNGINLQAGVSLQIGSLISVTPQTNVGNREIVRYNIALGGSDGMARGRLSLDGAILDASKIAQLTDDELIRLTYVSDNVASNQADFLTITATAKFTSGTGLVNEVSSLPIQIALSNYGAESTDIANSINAPESQINGNLRLAQTASILTGRNDRSQRPSISAESYTTSGVNDLLQLGNLISTKQAGVGVGSGSVTRYQLAIIGQDGSAASGYLSLDQGVTNLRNDPNHYNAALGIYTVSDIEMLNLGYLTGNAGTTDKILITAIKDVPSSAPGITEPVYSKPVELTNSVTGSRSLNLAGAVNSGLMTRYKVTLTDISGAASTGILTLDGGATNLADDPAYFDAASGIYTIPAAELVNLQFFVGGFNAVDRIKITPINEVQDGLTGVTKAVAKPVIDITNKQSERNNFLLAEEVANFYSVNDSWFDIANRSIIYAAKTGETAPGIAVAGNISIASGDRVALYGLIQTSNGKFRDGVSAEVTRYNIAVRDEAGGAAPHGKILLQKNGGWVDVTHQGQFTETEMLNLFYQSDGNSTLSFRDQLIVSVYSEQKNAAGIALNTISSAANAFYIEVAPNGSRSLAVADYITSAVEDNFFGIAQAAKIFLNAAKSPTISSTTGNITLDSFQQVRVADLISGGTSKGNPEITHYKAGLNTKGNSVNGGQILLDGRIVAGSGVLPANERTEFTAEEYERLIFVSGVTGSSASLVVAAESRVTNGTGGQLERFSSPALEINAEITGKNSLNVAGNIIGTGRGNAGSIDDAVTSLAQTAAIFKGKNGTKPLGLVTNLQGDYPDTGSVFSFSPLQRINPGDSTFLVPDKSVSVGDWVSFAGLDPSLSPAQNPASIGAITVLDTKPLLAVSLDTQLAAELAAGDSIRIDRIGSGLIALKYNSPLNSNLIFLDPSLALQTGDVVLDEHGNMIGTVTSVNTASAVTVSSPFIRSISEMDQLLFQKKDSLSSIGKGIGQYFSTASPDRSIFTNFDTGLVGRQNGYNIVSGFAAPGTQATRTALFLLNSNQIGGYQTTDLAAVNKRFLSVG